MVIRCNVVLEESSARDTQMVFKLAKAKKIVSWSNYSLPPAHDVVEDKVQVSFC